MPGGDVSCFVNPLLPPLLSPVFIAIFAKLPKFDNFSGSMTKSYITCPITFEVAQWMLLVCMQKIRMGQRTKFRDDALINWEGGLRGRPKYFSVWSDLTHFIILALLCSIYFKMSEGCLLMWTSSRQLFWRHTWIHGLSSLQGRTVV